MSQPTDIKVNLTHYRCFHDSSPVEFSLEAGKTIAVVGKNNSGKSALMRFFYEFRNALSNFSINGWTPHAHSYWEAKFSSSTDIGPRYGLSDLLDIYPQRDSSKSVRVSLSVLGVFHELEVTTPPLQHFAQVFTRKLTVRQADAAPVEELSRIIRNMIYLGAHRNLVNEGAGGGTYYDLSVGS